jgi:hypothetical protein
MPKNRDVPLEPEAIKRKGESWLGKRRRIQSGYRRLTSPSRNAAPKENAPP